MANSEHEEMAKTLYREIKEYNSLMFDYIKSLDARCSTMMSVVAVIMILYINYVETLIGIACSVVLIINLLFYVLSFILYGISFIWIRRFRAAPEPVHLIDEYYGKPFNDIMINLIENAVYVSRKYDDVISKRVLLMKYGGSCFIVAFILTFISLVLLITKGG